MVDLQIIYVFLTLLGNFYSSSDSFITFYALKVLIDLSFKLKAH